jgi:Putative prokaryotic signal transducing protein
MDTASWVYLGRIGGNFNADILKGLFEAQGIQVEMYQEGAGKSVFPVTFGMLGDVDIYVKADDLEIAKEILAEIQMDYILPEDEDAEENKENSGESDSTGSESQP